MKSLLKTPPMIAALSLTILVLIIIVLVNVGSSNHQTTSSTPSTSTSSQEVYSDQDAAFLNKIHIFIPETSDFPNTTLTSAAQWVCSTRASGYSENSIINSETQYFSSVHYAAVFVRASGEAYCPAQYW